MSKYMSCHRPLLKRADIPIQEGRYPNPPISSFTEKKNKWFLIIIHLTADKGGSLYNYA